MTGSPTDNPFGVRVLIVIPAYNEAENLPGVMADIAAHAPWADTVVIDDCSSDDTAAVARSLGAVVLQLPCNLGVGGTMQTGYLYAHAMGYEAAVQFDGDGQHRADQIAGLAEGFRQGGDLTIGSRMLGRRSYRFPFLRWMGLQLLRGCLALLNGVRLTDPTSGFRASSKRMIEFFAHHYPQSYLGDTVEAVATAARHGMQIREVPTRMRKAQASSITSLGGLFHTLRTCLAIFIDRLERPLFVPGQDRQADGDDENPGPP